MSCDRTLVAGLGNVFLGDDAFGVEVVRRLATRPLPPRVEVADVGIRGVHLAYRLLDGYRLLVLVDAVGRGAEPGTLFLVETEPGTALPPAAAAGPLDGHGMTPDEVLSRVGVLATGLGGTVPERVLVVGCQPADVTPGMGLSAPVTAAVDRAVEMVLDIVHREESHERTDAVGIGGGGPGPAGPQVPAGHQALLAHTPDVSP